MQSPYLGNQMQQGTTLTWLLVGDIREMLQDHLDEEALRWLRPVLDSLIRTMCEETQQAEEQGWFDDVLEPCPHLSKQVAEIEAEQRELCKSLEHLRHRIDMDLPLARLASELEGDLADWVHLMMEHNRREGELMQDALYTEIGGEG